MPGGPLAPYLQNPHITPADIARLKHNLGMDQPVPIQYLKWLGHVLTGDIGYSTSNSEPVFQALIERFPATLELMGASLVISIAIGVACRHHLGGLPLLRARLLHHDAGASSGNRCRSSGSR